MATEWFVGPTRFYKIPGAVAALVQTNDIVTIDSGTYVGGNVVWNTRNLTIRGIGRVRIVPNVADTIATSLWELHSFGMTIKGIQFEGFTSSDITHAALSVTAGQSVIQECTFLGNATSIRIAGTDTVGAYVRYCDFEQSMTDVVPSVAIRCGPVKFLEMEGNYFHGTNPGDDIISSCRELGEYWCFHRDERGLRDACIVADLRCRMYIRSCSYERLQDRASTTMMSVVGTNSFGTDSVGRIYCVFSTFVTTSPILSVFAMNVDTAIVLVENCLVAGTQHVVQGERVLVDSQTVVIIPDRNAAGFVDVTRSNYHLRTGSPALNRVSSMSTFEQCNGTRTQEQLQPIAEYRHPTSSRNRTNERDAGAFAFDAAQSAEDDVIAGLFNISPNPASDNVSCSIPDRDLNAEIIIMNMQGGEVARYRATEPHMVIDTHDLPSAMYVVRCGTSSVLLSIIR